MYFHEYGKKAEYLTASWLTNSHKFRIKRMLNVHAPYDLLVNGKHRIDVKSAHFGKGGGWVFNIRKSHDLRLDESKTDFYIFRLEPGTASFLLGKNPIYLVLPAPLRVKVVRITVRSLLTRYAKYFNNVANMR